MTESVARVRIVANIEGLEGFDKLKNAFKGLQQAIGPTEQQLAKARQDIIAFGEAGKKTEQVIRGQVEALRSLQSQADLTGEVYGEIASDISRLEAALRGTTPALERQRTVLLQNASANRDNAEALARNVQQLERLRAETRPGSSAYAQLGRDIQTLRTRITGITGAAAEFRLTLTQIPGASLGVLARQVGTLQRGMQGLRVASDEYLRTAERIALLQTIQGRFTGRQQVRANFEMFASEQFAGFAEGPGERLILPDTTAALQQRLSELGQELQNVARDSERYINVALRMAGVQRELSAATQGLGQRLADQLANGELPRTQRNLQEAISQLRSEMSDLDTTTADGSREYAQRASVVTTLTQQLNRLAEAYRNVSDAQRSQPVSQFTLARGQQPYDPSSGRRAPGVLTDAETASVEGARNVAQNARAAFDSIGDIADTALRRLVDLEEKHFQEMLSLAEEHDERELEKKQQAFQRQLAAFDAQLTAADRLAVRSGQLKMMLGVGGRDLSPLYQSIVEMGSSREASAEMFMRKSPTEVLRDITDTFTDTFADASRALDSGEKEIRRAALEFAGNAKAVRGAFEQIPLGDKRVVLGGPRSLFPNEGESPADYTRRVGSLYPTIGVENRTFGQAIGDFVAQIKFRTQQLEKATDGDARSAQRLRQRILEFVEGIDNGADTVRAAFGRYKLGREPIGLYAAAGESPREYVARLGGGVADPIPDLSDFSKKSIRELNIAKQALEQYRAELSPTGVAFQTLERTAVRSIRNIDRELERRSPGGRLAGKIGYIGQGIGAAASAGIFGGPEGAIGGIGGGLIGALAGGPAGFAAGAFIGSSAGAYAGMGRQQLGLITTYAADISKLEIALKGVTKTQEEYQRALAASASVTRDFNVPQLEATRGMTQLSAAVIGAGGKVADAEVVFRNVTAAIKASGGTSEDVQGALTALGQVFSKGKVSAEELQGQLGERLPGAVTMFAKATGRTLPQLQKDLEQGVVGLADLMKFITSDQGLGQFEQRAKSVAQSSAEAGARLTTTWNDTKRAIGEALLPLGAQIQDSLTQALKAATPALVSLAQGVAALTKLLVDNAGAVTSTIAAVSKVALIFTGATFAVKAFGALIGPIQQGLLLLSGAFGTVTAQTVVAQNKLTAFGATFSKLARAFAAPLVITVAIVGAQLVIDYFNRIKAARDRLVKTVSDATGAEWLRDIGGSALDRQRLTKAVDEVGKAYQEAADKASRLRKERDRLQQLAATSPSGTLFSAVRLEEVNAQLELAEAQEKLLESRYKAGIARLPNAPNTANPLAGLTGFPAAAGKGDLDRDALDEAEKEKQQLALQTAEQQRTLDNKIFQNQVELDRRRYELQQQLIDLNAQNEIDALTGVAKEYAGRADQFRKQIRDMYRQSTEASLQAAIAQQQAQSARTVQAVAGSGIQTTGMIARTGNTGDSTGPHLDLRWGDGRPITKADADKYFLVNGRAPSSFGVTSAYGPRSLFGRSFHSGIDFGAPSGSALSLKGGATFLRDLGNTGAGGYAIEVMTPEGTMKALHLMAKSVTVSGANRGQVRASRLVGGEEQDASQAAGLRDLQLKDEAARAEKMISLAVKQNTVAVRERIAVLADEAEINKKRFRLQMEGARPEIIEREIEALKLRQQQIKETATAQALLAQKEEDLAAIKDKQSEPAKILTAEIEVQKRTLAELPGLYDNLRLSLENATAAQIAFNDAMRFRQDNRIGEGIRDGAQQYVESIGTMREATAQLAQNGIKGVEDAIFSLVTTGTTNFREFAAEILKQTTRMIIQQLILRSIMQIIGAIPGGGGSALAKTFEMPGTGFPTSGFKFADGGIVDRPTLFKFANGGVPRTGLMGEAGPEAIIPLKRGRDGKLGVSGGGNSTNVTVNVDASGSSVQGNAGQGEALGRAISQAVQQELIKQRRPGGLLAA